MHLQWQCIPRRTDAACLFASLNATIALAPTSPAAFEQSAERDSAEIAPDACEQSEQASTCEEAQCADESCSPSLREKRILKLFKKRF